MFFDDGDGFVKCSCGRRHWGVHGAAGLLIVDPARGVLLQRRAWWLHHGRTWAIPGGALRSTESAVQAAMREATEEAAVPREAVRFTASSIDDHGTWSYTTVLAATRTRVSERISSAESAELSWIAPDEVDGYRLHRDFAAAWPELRGQLRRSLVLVVDGDTVARVPGTAPGPADAPRPELTWQELTRLVRDGIGARDVGIGPGPHWRWWPRVELSVPGDGPPSDRAGIEVVPAGHGTGAAEHTLRIADRAVRAGEHVVVVTANDSVRAGAHRAGTRTLDPRELGALARATG
ncbi:NUDIX hydrolase [Haloechinothrix sp. YIM 98757]|uniref:NUDIX hydrolase n=1 Tax=Haloechinothrix aidingensis TaxID=2752311 RepID=A0A838A8U5_9PSEU|nr:NUDIX hydrolase [Haloechinothrix aidingensis]